MRALVAATLVGALAQAPPPPAPAPGQAPPVFPTEVELFSLEVTVVDDAGRPARDLTAASFEVTVGGRPRRVVSAEFVEQTGEVTEPPPPSAPARFTTNETLVQGRLVLLAIDQGNIASGGGREVIRAAERLLNRLGPADRVGLVTLPGPEPREEFTTDHARVRTALQQISGRGRLGGRRVSLLEALALGEREDDWRFEAAVSRECRGNDPTCRLDLESEARSVWLEYQEQSRRSLSVLESAFEVLGRLPGTKVLVLVSQGLGLPGVGPRLRVPPEMRAVSAAVATGQVAFYAVRVDPGSAPDMESNLPSEILREDRDFHDQGLDILADSARGTVLRQPPEMAFERVAREISGYYLLGFEPEGKDRDGRPHDVRVKVTRRGLTVRAGKQVTIPALGLGSAVDAVKAALAADGLASGVLVKAASWALRDMATGKIRLLLGAETGRGERGPGLALGYVLLDEKGHAAASGIGSSAAAGASVEPAEFLATAAVAPGNYRLRVAARDPQGRVGSVEHLVAAVLTEAGGLELSDLLLSLAPAEGGPLRPRVDLRLPEGPFLAHLELYAGDPELLASVSVWFDIVRADTAAALRSVRGKLGVGENGQRMVAQGLLSADGLAPGVYVVRATVLRGEDSLKSLAQPFRVLPR